MPFSTDTSGSEFNMGVSKAETLRFICNSAIRCFYSSNPEGWLKAYMSLGMELSGDMTNEESDIENKHITKVRSMLPIFYGQSRRGNRTMDWKLIDALRDYGRYMNSLMKKYGYMTKYKDDLLKPEGKW